MKRSVLIRLILYSAMICISYWIVRLHSPNPKDRLDNKRVLDIYKYVLDQVGEKPLGEEMYKSSRKLEGKSPYTNPEYTHFYRTLPVPVVEQANQKRAYSLTTQVRGDISDILSLAKQGVAFLSLESMKAWLEQLDSRKENQERKDQYDFINSFSFWPLTNFARSLLIESDMFYREGKWDEAFQSLKDIDTLAHALRHGWFSGHSLGATLRWYEAKGFERILFRNPPLEVDRRALNLLKSLCARHILFDEKATMIQEMWTIFMSAQIRHSFFEDFMWDVGTLSNLLHDKNAIEKPHNKRWLERITKRYKINTEPMDEYDVMDIFCPLLMVDWTTYPSIKKFLRRVGETETELIKRSSLVNAFRNQLPPLVRTRLIMAHAVPTSSLYASFIRSTVQAVRLELLRIAFASRLYYHDKKRFPKSVEELVPEYLERLPVLEYVEDFFPHTGFDTDPNQIISPVRIKKVQLDAYDICSVLRIRPKETWSEDRVSITPEGDFEWQNLSEEVANVMAQYLARFDRVMEGVAIKPAQDEKKRIVAKVKPPQGFLAIYSPGPDADDDGGIIAYDPTNGTTSSGDIIVYPEGFAR